MKLNQITELIIGEFIDIHRQLGPGLLESAYRECLYYELTKVVGLSVKREIPMPIIYKEIKLEQGYRMYLLVEDKVVIELKTVDFLTDVHKAQLLTYLKLGNYKIGLLINFNETLLKNGIKRIIN
ncbi:MAG: GxxExxY protein [Saprospirales bacterium]|nr:GxxExxY protein [Saprospirales bacterium]